MPGYQFVSFLTDYGSDDGFVATCHGVLLDIVPQVRIIDVSHAIPPQDIPKGARLLARVTPYLPVSVHVAVVDPGVGGARKAVAVETARGIFVGPDNGLLSWAVDNAGGPITSYELTNSCLFRSPVSRTFHGRDVFMPVAGHLAAGLALPEVGPELDPGSLVGTVRLTGLGRSVTWCGWVRLGLVDATSSLYKGHRYPVEIISH
ncbi:MAG: SAM hydrolase/SAM-dependent halogenase family protein, partial [Pseudonocardiaceae bacterium]